MRAGLGARATFRRRLRPAFGLAFAVLMVGCGGTDEPAAAPAVTTSAPATATSSVPATTAPPTTVASTTVAPTTAVPTTTAPPTTVADTLPHPISPPHDVYAAEPKIEMGSIAIPSIDVETTMYEGIRLTTLELGPGHWPGSAVPGQTGNLVVGGHRASGHSVFRNVDQLEPGDEIIFRDETGVHTYSVNRTQIVEPSDIWIVTPTETPTATLFACHPPGSTAQRIVVFADLVSTTGA